MQPGAYERGRLPRWLGLAAALVLLAPSQGLAKAKDSRACALGAADLPGHVALSDPGDEAGAGFDILPTLKGHMARLGSLMNFLFRHIDEPEKSAALQTAIREMRWHLRRADRFTPISFAALVAPETEQREQDRFKAGLAAADRVLAAMAEAIRESDLAAARRLLLRLDTVRRICHGAFG
ncbi:MAG: cytochrome b562 [Hyphomicrobiales bacterium]|nr:cytochrome b562 [Hyphomicrobiales bacterium]